jgi:malate dehydrogenase
MKRVSIIGAGNVGTNTAFFIAENRTASVTLVDVKQGMTTGKALDMMEAGPLRGYDTRVTGSDHIDSITGSDVVILAAGRVRRPGEHRRDLYLDNFATVKSICEGVKHLAPDAIVVNVVEPIDSITLLVAETLGFDRHRVVGVGGLLTSTRIRYLVSSALGISPREVTALVVGPHRDTMVVLEDTIRVAGVPAVTLLGRERLDAIIAEAKKAGDTILQLAKSSTSYYAPSASVAALVEAIVRDSHAIFSVSVCLRGEFGVNDLAVGVAARMGSEGVEKIIDPGMSDEESKAFIAAAADLRASIELARKQLETKGGGAHA